LSDSVYHPSFGLVLASASPRRRELLLAAGFEVEVVPADVDERRLDHEAPAAYVRRLAVAKAAAVAARLSDGSRVILGADTVVVVDGDVLGKPRHEPEASQMLRRLSGRTHRVLTGVALVCGEESLEAVESSEVTLVRLDEAAVAWYVATGEPMDKAGGYGIQGYASRFVDRIHGSYTNVVGLPVSLVDRLLRRLGQRA